jgi:hypothetical protein
MRNKSQAHTSLPVALGALALVVLLGDALAQDERVVRSPQADDLGHLSLSATHPIDSSTDVRTLSGADVL